MGRWMILLLLAAAGVSMFPLGMAAQATLNGTVLDNDTDRPVSTAVVELLRGGRVLRSVAATEAGAFSFGVAPSETYQLHVRRPGYSTVTTPPLRLPNLGVSHGETLSIEIRLDEAAVLLAPLTVRARSRGIPRVLQGFYDRRERRMGGHFFTREEIDRRGAVQVTDILREVPGVELRSRNGSSFLQSVYFRGGGLSEGDCPVQIFVDGVLTNRRVLRERATLDSTASQASFQSDDGPGIDTVVSPEFIEAIEVYRGLGSVPAEFLSVDAKCGVIAIWTTSGSGSPPE
jgi:hypothetical protein